MNKVRRWGRDGNHPPSNLSAWRIIRDLKKEAKLIGFDGDPHEQTHRSGSFLQESAITVLQRRMAANTRNLAPAFAGQIARNIVMNTERDSNAYLVSLVQEVGNEQRK